MYVTVLYVHFNAFKVYITLSIETSTKVCNQDDDFDVNVGRSQGQCSYERPQGDLLEQVTP